MLCSRVRKEWGSQDRWREKKSAFAMERLMLGGINYEITDIRAIKVIAIMEIKCGRWYFGGK